MRLLDDLGWAEREPVESFELTMPLDALARTMQRLQRRSPPLSTVLRAYTYRDDEEQRIAARHAIAASAYGRLLGRIAEIQ